MNFRALILYAAAGFAGWWGVALSDGDRNPDAVPAVATAAPVKPMEADEIAQDTLGKIRRPAAGSEELARIAALIAAIPNDSLTDIEAKVKTWPPGVTRDFALALLSERTALEEDPFADPSEPPEVDTEPPYNRFRELAESMTRGFIMSEAGIHRGTYADFATLEDWVFFDPAVATAAILKMPRHGSRRSAVETAVEMLSKTDPAAALEFMVLSGEQRPGRATAEAWAKLIIDDLPHKGASDAQRQFLDGMTREQQDSLFESLAGMSFNDSNTNSHDPLRGSDLGLIARCVLQGREPGTGMELFFTNLDEDHPRAAEEVRQFILGLNQPAPPPGTPLEIEVGPTQKLVLEIFDAARMQRAVDAGDDALQSLGAALWANSFTNDSEDALLNRAAPSLVPSLARNGRLPEALELLGHISDAESHCSALQGLLPTWMDADPVAARAAYEAAPLTALHREQWERHPAFLLHPPAENQ